MTDLTPLLEAGSVAVVGASDRPGNFGRVIVDNLLAQGFEGSIVPVHPRAEPVRGLAAVPEITDLPDGIDCAIVGLGQQHCESAIKAVAARGIPAAVVFADPNVGEGRDPSTESRVAAIARDAGIAMLGMNGMGLYSLHQRLVVSGYDIPTTLAPGGVCLVSHSGTVFDSITHSPRLAFNMAVSGGNESVVTESDYLAHMLRDPRTTVVGLYLETVRQPQAFLEALEDARRRRIPIVALKVGATEKGQAMAQAHTGALAGGPEAYAAVFRRFGVHQVCDLGEMVDTLHLLSTLGPRPGAGIGVVMDSGGERSLFTDLADEAGVELAELAPATLQALRDGMEPGKEPANPVDPFGSSHLIRNNFANTFAALDADPGVGVIVLSVDFQRDATYPLEYLEALEALDLDADVVTLLNLPEISRPDAVDRLEALGVPRLHGTRSGLAALRHLVQSPPQHFEAVRAGTPPEPLLADWRRRLASAEGPLDEADSKRLLTAYGIPVPAGGQAESLDQALAIAAEMGYPVAAKALGIAHKSDRGALVLDIDGPDALAEAYASLTQMAEKVLVERMVRAEHELLVGATRDEQFGPMVLLGMGGVYAEVVDDTAVTLAPTNPAEAAAMARRLRAAPVLQGARGRAPVDLDMIVGVVLRVATLAADFADEIDEIDVNPLAVHGSSVTALDALVIPR